MTQPTLINLNPDECNKEFHYYPLAFKLDTCVRSCNTFNDLSHNVCTQNKTEYLNLIIFNIITEINESQILTKDISWEFKCRFDGKIVFHINGGIMINVDVSVKNAVYVKKIIFGILLHVTAKMENIWQVLWMIHRLCEMKL